MSNRIRILFLGEINSTHAQSWIELLFPFGEKFDIRALNLSPWVSWEDAPIPVYSPAMKSQSMPENVDNARNFTPPQVWRHYISLQHLFNIKVLTLTEEIFDEFRPHVVHTFGFFPSALFYSQYLAHTRLQWQPKWVLQTRGGSDLAVPRNDPKWRDCFAEIVPKADCVICDNEVNFEILETMGAPAKRHSALSLAPGSGGMDPPDRVTSIETRERLIVWPKAYECEYSKGLPILEALMEAWDAIAPVRIECFAVDNEIAEAIARLPETIRSAIAVYTRRPRDEVLRTYENARAMLTPSLVDGIPNTLYEAMCAGVVPIVSPIETLVRHFEGGRHVLFAHNLRPDQIAATIIEAMNNDTLASAMIEFNLGAFPDFAKRSNVRKKAAQMYTDLAVAGGDGEVRQSIHPSALEKRKPLFKKILHIGQTDLTGNKFNGHDLHLYQRKDGFDATSLVVRKDSRDPTTFVGRGRTPEVFSHYLLRNPLFLDADVVHLHQMHSTPFDLGILPLMSSLKPIVWTLHDPWLLGGHCVHPDECGKWRTHCRDCEHLDVHFRRGSDTSALEFEIKRRAVQNSPIHFIVASKWLEKMAQSSPILVGRKITRIPIGIDTEFYSPGSSRDARRRLGVDTAATVLFFRQQSAYKGTSFLVETLRRSRPDGKAVLFAVGSEKALLSELADQYEIREYGWVREEQHLRDLYRACDMFLMPSEQETFGLMAVEAMSCGKVVLALEGTALPEIIDSPRCGLAVSREKFGSEMQRLLGSPGEILERGERSRKYALEYYGLRRYLDAVADVYVQAFESYKLDAPSRLVLDQLKTHARDEARLHPSPQSALRDRLNALGHNTAERLCIFCAGAYGRKVFSEFSAKGVHVDCFSDNDASKWETIVEGKACLPPCELDKNKTLVIVCRVDPKGVANNLTANGFEHVATYVDVWDIINDTLPGDFVLMHTI